MKSENKVLLFALSFIFLMISLLTINSVYAATVDDGNTNSKMYFELQNSSIIDNVNAYSGSVGGTATFVAGKIGNAVNCDAADEAVAFTESYFDFERTDAFSFGYWNYKNTDAGIDKYTYIKMEAGGGSYRGIQFGFNGAEQMSITLRNTAGSNQITTHSTMVFSPATWYHILITYDGSSSASGLTLYVNGSSVALVTDSDTLTGTILNNVVPQLCEPALWSDNYLGMIDEFWVADYEAPLGMAEFLYNSGSPASDQQYFFIGAAPTAPTLTATESYSATETELSNTTFSLNIDWALSNISNSSATLIYDGDSYSTSKISSYTINGSGNHSTTIITPLIEINNTDKTFFFNYSITNSSGTFQYNTSLFNQSLLWNKPRLNISRVYNAYTGTNLSNFTGNISKGSWITSFNTTSGFKLLPLLNGSGNYTAYVQAEGYAISNLTNYKNLEITDPTNLTIKELSFGLYSNNSVFVRVYDEASSDLILTNISLTVSGNSTEQTLNIFNGSLFVENLQDGEYNFKFDHDNYTSRTFTVTVAQNSFQYLNAYLTASNNLVTLILRDGASSTTIEDVTLTMSRLINSSWVVVESKASDITGRAQFSYINNIKYRFFASHADYTSKTFDLDPILFTSYNVLLDRVVAQDQEIDYSKVNIAFNPKIFYNDAQNNFTIYFASPSGNFETYSYNVTYPSGSIAGSGTSSIGENFAGDVNITGATMFDTINITYTYDTTIGDERSYSFSYYIIGSETGNNTFLSNKDNTFGMGTLERILISTGLAIAIGGTVTLFVGAVAGLAIALLFMGIFTVIGFYPIWLFLLSALVGFVLLVKTGS